MISCFSTNKIYWFNTGVKKNFRLLLLCVLVCLDIFSQAQQNKTIDTTGFGNIPDTLLFRIQKAQAVIAEVNTQNKKSYGIIKNRDLITEIKANTDPINTDMKTTGKVVDSKTLSEYSYIVNDAEAKLNTLRNNLTAASNDLQRSLNQVVILSSDSLLIISAGDTSAKNLYANQLINLRLQLQNAGSITTEKLNIINQLLATSSALYIQVNDLQIGIDDELDSRSKHALQKEVPYLWQAPFINNVDNTIQLFHSTASGQTKILAYFVASTWDYRILLLILSVIFFIWIFRNYRKSKRLNNAEEEIKFMVVRPVPVTATLLFVLNLAPLFEPEAPPVYMESIQLILVIVLAVYLWRRLSKIEFLTWLIFAVSFILMLISNPLVNTSMLSRLWLIVLNFSFIWFGIVIKRKLIKEHLNPGLIKPALIFYISLQVLSIILNILGRVSLAKVLGTTGIYTITQVISLAGFVHAATEAMELQMLVSTSGGGLFSRVNTAHTRRSLKRLLVWLSVIIWCIVLFISLGISNELYSFFSGIFFRQHTIGSINFSIGNILLFLLIIYLSLILERNVGLLFGNGHLTSQDNDAVLKSSKAVLIKLVIVIVGFFVAIAASGISLTKITVVLGALSVGIGLGMQNIVSNFVSGIILIFEKPFQIGDYVELGDKKGKIEDIGIRSSKMLTLQGSEVIIPNGDFLSNRLTNWTSNNLYMKTELIFKISAETNIEEVYSQIKESIKKTEGILKNSVPDVLVDALGADYIQLKNMFWITNLYSEAILKSKIFQQLLADFKTKGIKVM